jgi:signal peptidase II
MSKKYILFVVIFLLSLAADQGTKTWVRSEVKGRPYCSQANTVGKCKPIRVIDGFFDITYSENDGAAFSLLRGTGARWVFFGIGLVALTIIGVFVRNAGANELRHVAELALLAGGAAGNLADRMIFGHVTDFIYWHWHEHSWPVFNIADAALVVGVFALVLDKRKPADGKEPDKEKKMGKLAAAQKR